MVFPFATTTILIVLIVTFLLNKYILKERVYEWGALYQEAIDNDKQY